MKEFFCEYIDNKELDAQSKITFIKVPDGIRIKLQPYIFDENLIVESYIPYSEFINQSNMATTIIDKLISDKIACDLPTKTFYSLDKYLNKILQNNKPYLNDDIISPTSATHLRNIFWNTEYYKQVAVSNNNAIFVLYDSLNPYEDYFMIHEFMSNVYDESDDTDNPFIECNSLAMANAEWNNYVKKYNLTILTPRQRQAYVEYLDNVVSPKLSIMFQDKS